MILSRTVSFVKNFLIEIIYKFYRISILMVKNMVISPVYLLPDSNSCQLMPNRLLSVIYIPSWIILKQILDIVSFYV